MEFKQVDTLQDLSLKITDALNADSMRLLHAPMEHEKRVAVLTETKEKLITGDFNAVFSSIDSIDTLDFPTVKKNIQQIREKITAYKEQYNLRNQTKDTKPQNPYKELPAGREVTQRQYDIAAKNGFPDGFFKNAQFTDINFYCFPKHADFEGAKLRNCKFNMCAAPGVSFKDAHIYDSTFSQINMKDASFEGATFAHNRVDLCNFEGSSFHNIRMKGGYICESNLAGVNMMHADIDGTNIFEIEGVPKSTETIHITMGGATKSEVATYKNRLLENLNCSFGQPKGINAKLAAAQATAQKRKAEKVAQSIKKLPKKTTPTL